MTIFKRINQQYVNEAEGLFAVHMLKVAARTGHIDSDQLQKIGSGGDTPLLRGMTCGPGESLLHVIAVGAGEKWGPNSNGDYFNKGPRRIFPQDPDEAETPFYDARTGLKDRLHTYEKEGGLYFEHHNRTKGAKSKGTIDLSFYNEPMERGELVIRVQNDKHAALLSSIERGDPTFVSQGCSVPYDVCNQCLHKALTPKEYCNHMKYHKLKMTKRGSRVYVHNPRPTFHDISIVKVPAFIPAFVLGMRRGMTPEQAFQAASQIVMMNHHDDFVKVAGLEIPEYAVYDFLKTAHPNKMALVEKLSDMEKEVPGMVNDAVISGVKIPEATRRKLTAAVSGKHPADVVSEMKINKQMLPPSVFKDIFDAEQPSGCASVTEGGYRRALRSVYQDLLQDPASLQEVVDSDDYRANRAVLNGKGLSDYREELTLDPAVVLRKAERNSLGGNVPALSHKTASIEPNDSEVALAREYARYMLSAVEGLPDAMLKIAILKKYWD